MFCLAGLKLNLHAVGARMKYYVKVKLKAFIFLFARYVGPENPRLKLSFSYAEGGGGAHKVLGYFVYAW